MPVLSQNDVLKMGRDAMDRRNHAVAARNGERAAGTKIILQVDDEERVAGIDSHHDFLNLNVA